MSESRHNIASGEEPTVALDLFDSSHLAEWCRMAEGGISHRGLKEEEIFDELFEHIGLFHDIEDIAECQELTEWHFDEGRRLHRESRKP